jgi:hypothetical protein
MLRHSLVTGCVAIAMALAATGSVAYAGGNGQGGNDNPGQNNGNQGNGGPNVAATPELDSSVLFAFGTAALAGVTLVRRRLHRGGSDSEEDR